ncbi:type II toxin-antitoxin system RelE/ParE family toxin [Aureimonas sp. AU12]|uniref:type II toxin-antitoxin system RelE/ParE family toxin n=1 Tax=Aureimonas sp. AU12 TaxID=1638161 RepID=UPI000AD45603|nr:type II toxin-antitoxin system RelE/ParE family toxin [Aureimonas sp. AU12]
MEVYKTKAFDRLARKAKVTDLELREAAREIREGRIDADLGAFLIKQRVSQGQGGRANAHRAIIATKDGDRIVFLHLFAKRDQENLTKTELDGYREAAKILAVVPQSMVKALLKTKEWIQIEEPHEPEGVSE